MKKKILLLLFLLPMLFAQGVKGQGYEFAPVGATWYYTLADYSIPEPYTRIKYMKIVSVKDTIFNDKQCRVLEEYRTKLHTLDDDLYFVKTHYFYSDSNKIFYFDEIYGDFVVLYDYNKNQGEYWLLLLDGNPQPECDTVRVESTGEIQINSHNLKTMNVSQWYCLGASFLFQYPIIEVIGHLHYLFPQADFPYEGPLRCYEDSIIGLYQTGVSHSCDYIGLAMINEFKEDSKINIFPNPFSEIFHLELLNFSKNIELKIFDLLGNCIYEKTYYEYKKTITIDLNHVMDGIYFISLNGIYFNKIIKSK